MKKMIISSAIFSGLHEEVRKAHEDNDIFLFESVKYVIDEKKVLKLFEKYGSEFPEENKESWRGRWMDNNLKQRSISIDNYKFGNNKHLLITILHEAHLFMKLNKLEPYIKLKWGIKSYHSDVTRYTRTPHPETKNIKIILESE